MNMTPNVITKPRGQSTNHRKLSNSNSCYTHTLVRNNLVLENRIHFNMLMHIILVLENMNIVKPMVSAPGVVLLESPLCFYGLSILKYLFLKVEVRTI